MQGMHHHLYRTSNHVGLRKFNDFFEFSDFAISASHLDNANSFFVLYWKRPGFAVDRECRAADCVLRIAY
ncbi:MAG TPA: hypothetical protein DD473_04060 [Planctomycetaceae bacterium]|nr:hypothetical protein [Planctomycetaceae bacterium]